MTSYLFITTSHKSLQQGLPAEWLVRAGQAGTLMKKIKYSFSSHQGQLRETLMGKKAKPRLAGTLMKKIKYSFSSHQGPLRETLMGKSAKPRQAGFAGDRLGESY